MDPARATEGLPRLGVVSAFDHGRALENKSFYSACYAPSSSMYFDQFGQVKPCCQSVGGIGYVTRQSIREIWESFNANRLREALAGGDLPAGCGFCSWQVQETGTASFARGFDDLAPDSLAPRWPLMMEFSMTNACNLQCVMCNGDLSSAIRTHREHRPPLPPVYGEAFFEELEGFLPHLKEAKFLGGEPFLGREPMRVLEMLAALEDPPRVTITTNATQWSPRIERLCERLPMSFVVSLDGISKATYESIRIGADFDEVMQNLLRFRDYARRHDTGVSIAHCLMVPNFHEFADLLTFAEANDLDAVGVNTVVFPAHLSLYQLDSAGLADVLGELVRIDASEKLPVGRFRPVWDHQIATLRARLHQLRSGSANTTVDPWFAALLVDPPTADEFRRLVADAEYFTAWFSKGLPVDTVLQPIIDLDERFHPLFGIRPSSVVGQPVSSLIALLSKRFGNPVDGPHSEAGIGVSMTFMDDDGQRSDAELLFVDEGRAVRLIVILRPVP